MPNIRASLFSPTTFYARVNFSGFQARKSISTVEARDAKILNLFVLWFHFHSLFLVLHAHLMQLEEHEKSTVI